MKVRKAPFSAALIATILATGAAQGGPISNSPSLSASLPADLERILASSPVRVDLAAANIAPGSIPTPVTGESDRAPEPAAMGLLGLGISGVVALRRLRKLFF
ncbi:PEP-CTERM sorting domain-containing protein [Paludisphaera rhizosphaerae]|uniref:PEP-CTERM sorting domain-containing protein n=1 Tax=Paludisphaera rhizosphaerae TaxID=2711216 RepID=UPI0013EB78B4|nr:PEP-CTERM sorting domain-containing protein [Paludisphaera rhizosphaerae]